MICPRCPNFLPVDDPLAAVFVCARTKAGQIRTGTGFRKQLTPPVDAARQRRQKTQVLLSRTEIPNDRSTHQGAEARGCGDDPGETEYLGDSRSLDDRCTAPTTTDRPMRKRQTRIGHRRPPAPHRLAGMPLLGDERFRIIGDSHRAPPGTFGRVRPVARTYRDGLVALRSQKNCPGSTVPVALR